MLPNPSTCFGVSLISTAVKIFSRLWKNLHSHLFSVFVVPQLSFIQLVPSVFSTCYILLIVHSYYSMPTLPKLGCIRSDYQTAVDDNLPFQMRPALMINELGLQLLACKMNDGGTKLRMIHVPRHPICHNLSHPDDNRLASLAPALRGAKPVRVGQFSLTWTMSKSKGGFQGVASTVLHSERKLNIMSDFLLPHKEFLFCRNIKDIFENLSNVADKYHLDDSVVDSFYQRSWKTSANYDACLEPATFVGHQTIRNIKSCIDSMSDEKDLHCWPSLQS